MADSQPDLKQYNLRSKQKNRTDSDQEKNAKSMTTEETTTLFLAFIKEMQADRKKDEERKIQEEERRSEERRREQEQRKLEETRKETDRMDDERR